MATTKTQSAAAPVVAQGPSADAEVKRYANRRLKAMQRRPKLVRAFWKQADLAL